MRVATAVGEALAELGADTVFGVIGSGNFAVTNALRAAGVRFVAARHETAAVCMADGYARVSGRLGVATVHQGPGLTNATTGLTEAAKARTPLLLLAADTSSGAVRSNFRIDQADLAAAVGAVPERLHGPETALDDLARAYRTAVAERRTVALMLPLDVQSAAVSDAVTVTPPPALRPATASPDTIAELADLVVASQRPAIVAGRGAVLAGAGEPLRLLGERIGAILATSANGNGLFTGDPHAVGISGGFATPLAAQLLADADLLLAFGASLNMWTTRHGTLVGPETRVVQVDVESDAVRPHRPLGQRVVADPPEVAPPRLPHQPPRRRDTDAAA
jgi:thiamine pyrophosphate-dependent acetolactate synthase large subunit-like protein